MLARCLDAGRRAVALLVYVGSVAWASAAFAQTVPDDLARRHFDSGVAYLEESDYENALAAFQKAHDLSKRPEILLNIATVQERRGDLEAAIAALDGYLQAEPSGEHAEISRLRIDNLRRRLEAESAPPAPLPVPPPPAPSVAVTPPLAPAPPPRQPRGVGKAPGIITLSVGGAAAVTAVVTGIIANAKYQSAEDVCSPYCTDEQLSSAETLAWISTISTGVAVFGVGLGSVLVLTSSGGRSASNAPALQVGFGPHGPNARASLRF